MPAVNPDEARHAVAAASYAATKLIAEMQRVVDATGRSEARLILRECHAIAMRIEAMRHRIENAA